ncbi:hypothetical protein GCM10022415_29080 [Knoellia locipacati]|uniref:Uncharacterized protein n=1 Tax=Knoellia locipacati TaxID=882824 RepID=A0A512T4K0_9MICO|nr:hypothetical protein KLO01_31940 [Knoellia locipacati]
MRTYPGDPKVWDTMPENLRSDDSHKVIIGEDFLASITGDWNSYSKHINPSTIAKQVGGKLIPPK